MQAWTRVGRIFEPDGRYTWMKSHASVPIAGNVSGDNVEVFFSTRDDDNKGAVGRLVFGLSSLEISELSEQPLLRAGALGCFDDSGVMASSLVDVSGERRLYYIGWNLGVTVPFRNSIGLAILNSHGDEFERCFDGPIIDRTRDEPHFCASNCVIRDGDKYKIWYLSCTKWTRMPNGSIRHHYHIKYAESVDGINWNRKGLVAIDYSCEEEYAISVPRVIKEDGIYKMWFSSRGSAQNPNYTIKYAESLDGITWQRLDQNITFLNSAENWESQMMCYPCVFDVGKVRYMLYNGNGYGKTGFGLARLDNEKG